MSRILSRATAIISTDGINPSATPNVFFDGTQTLSAATTYCVPQVCESTDRYRFVFICSATGSPLGSVKLQGVIDASENWPHYADLGLTNWEDLEFDNGLVSMPVNGATTIVLDENACNYAYVRLVLSLTSGTIAPVARFQFKGDGGR